MGTQSSQQTAPGLSYFQYFRSLDSSISGIQFDQAAPGLLDLQYFMQVDTVIKLLQTLLTTGISGSPSSCPKLA